MRVGRSEVLLVLADTLLSKYGHKLMKEYMGFGLWISLCMWSFPFLSINSLYFSNWLAIAYGIRKTRNLKKYVIPYTRSDMLFSIDIKLSNECPMRAKVYVTPSNIQY
jgi:hypothetical protein